MAYHVLAVAYPGRGHINPMMNLCKILSSLMPSHHQDMLITFVVTEEWKNLLGSGPTMPKNINISTIPNVLPSEFNRANDFPGFYDSVMTKMEAPFESLLQNLQTQVTIIIADAELLWIVPLANKWNIPVAILFTSSASVFSMFLHYHLLPKNEHLGINLSGRLYIT